MFANLPRTFENLPKPLDLYLANLRKSSWHLTKIFGSLRVNRGILGGPRIVFGNISLGPCCPKQSLHVYMFFVETNLRDCAFFMFCK